MKNLTLKLDGLNPLTKEQMKMVTGGARCSGTIDCYDDRDFYCGTVPGAVDCDDAGDSSELCAASFGDDCDFPANCHCTAP